MMGLEGNYLVETRFRFKPNLKKEDTSWNEVQA